MHLTAFETFLAIVETGSLVRASDQLNVSQSTVTARLKSLETEVGQTLVRRHKSGIELTPAGLTFRRYADVMLDLWQQARSETGLPDTIDAVFNLGCERDLWPGLGSTLFHHLHAEHRDTALSAWPARESDLRQWLRSGRIDAALSYEAVAADNQNIYTLTPDRLTLVSNRPDSPERFDPAYVFVESGDEFRRRHAAEYADADTAKVTFGSAVWALDHLLGPGGSAYLPERLTRSHIKAGRLHRIEGAPTYERNVYLLTTERSDTAWSWLPDLAVDIASGTHPKSDRNSTK